MMTAGAFSMSSGRATNASISKPSPSNVSLLVVISASFVMENLLSIFRWTAKQWVKNLTVIEKTWGNAGNITISRKARKPLRRVEDRGSKVEDRGSRIEGRRSPYE